MSSCGIDRRTGKVLQDWEHVLQSVDTIFATEVGERVMRRTFGGGNRSVLGRKMTPAKLAVATALIALAIAAWEPRLRVVKVSMVLESAETARQGEALFEILAAYRPKGHLGDMSEDRVTFGFGVGEGGNLTVVRVS